MVVPDGLSIVVRMNIDKPRRHNAISRINLFTTAAGDGPNCRDDTIAHANITHEGFTTAAIDDAAIADNEIEFRF